MSEVFIAAYFVTTLLSLAFGLREFLTSPSFEDEDGVSLLWFLFICLVPGLNIILACIIINDLYTIKLKGDKKC